MNDRSDWRRTEIASDGSHHLIDGRPLSTERFERVLAFHEPGLAPVRRDGQAWHIDPLGHPAYTLRFRETFGFYEGRAAVVNSGGWHHVLSDGRAVYAERYAWCGNYQGDRCAVRDREQRYRHLDMEGRSVGDARWRYAGDYREGAAVVQADDGRSTHLDPSGSLAHGRWFLDLDVFHKGYARARDARGWTHVDRKGDPIYEGRFEMVERFYNGQARVGRFDGGLEVIGVHGECLVELRAADERSFQVQGAASCWRTVP